MTQPEPTVDPDLPPGARQRLFSPVTATLICGHQDAILVDALLTLDQARRLAGWIAAHGKNLTSVYITHAHGDHWFGLSAILDRYPAARALTLPAALDQMHRLNTPEIVAAFWETRFPGKLPDKLMSPRAARQSDPRTGGGPSSEREILVGYRWTAVMCVRRTAAGRGYYGSYGFVRAQWGGRGGGADVLRGAAGAAALVS